MLEKGFEAIASSLEAIAIRLGAISSRLEAIASIASRLEAIAVTSLLLLIRKTWQGASSKAGRWLKTLQHEAFGCADPWNYIYILIVTTSKALVTTSDAPVIHSQMLRFLSGTKRSKRVDRRSAWSYLVFVEFLRAY